MESLRCVSVAGCLPCPAGVPRLAGAGPCPAECGFAEKGVRRWGLLFVGLLLLFSPGCSGCRPDANPDADEEKKEEERVEDFETKEIRVLPTDDNFAAYGIKPGHWVSSQQQLKANKTDFYGDLVGFSGGRNRDAYRLPNTPYALRSKRPAVLPKGQGKVFELPSYVPPAAAAAQQVWLYQDLHAGLSSVPRLMNSQVINRMRPFQYFVVVLAERPEGYGYLKSIESIRPPTDEMQLGQIPGDYIVLLPGPGRSVPLPSWSIMWTNIAYLIWDNFDADRLTLEQQRAMVDWLHWGGQVVVSGPESLDSLRSSFLAKYLPADAGSSTTLTTQNIEALDQFWSVAAATPKLNPRFPVRPDSPPSRSELRLRESAQFVPHTEELVAERRVGRGRVAVTSFALTASEFMNWRCFDNFLNAAILRRPPREFLRTNEGLVRAEWIDEVMATLARTPINQGTSTAEYEWQMELQSDQRRRLVSEAFIATRLRYFSRDADLGQQEKPSLDTRRVALDADGYRCERLGGVAGWNDFSRCSELARAGLTTAAGISVPERRFILLALALYLFVLVPANWVVFRAIGRVEWAWAAVPIIAMIGTLGVIRMAQLDIGFVRSRTEIAIVETQADFARSHVTRYTGIYSSLSTDYTISFEDEASVAMPFPTASTSSAAGSGGLRSVSLVHGEPGNSRVALRDFAVSSNSTGMIHSEQMHEFGGGIRLVHRGGNLFDLVNDSTFEWRDVGVLRRRDGNLEFGWVGRSQPGSSLQLRFRVIAPEDPAQHWQSFGELAGLEAVDFNLRDFLELAIQPARLNEGDVRAVGWSESEVPGMTIEPSSSQLVCRTLWVGNLQFGDLPRPVSDSNAPTDFAEYRRGDADTEEAIEVLDD